MGLCVCVYLCVCVCDTHTLCVGMYEWVCVFFCLCGCVSLSVGVCWGYEVSSDVVKISFGVNVNK